MKKNNDKNEDKKTLTEKILTILQKGTEIGIDLINIYFSSYKTRRKRRWTNEFDFHFETDWALWHKERQNFHSRLNQLKRDGLVKKKGEIWQITSKGSQKIESITKKKILIKKIPTKNLIIISYDIPEKFKKDRNWLREILKVLDFVMVHKSVWVGNMVLPEELIQEFKNKQIFDYVQIFEIGKAGTLKKLALE